MVLMHAAAENVNYNVESWDDDSGVTADNSRELTMIPSLCTMELVFMDTLTGLAAFPQPSTPISSWIHVCTGVVPISGDDWSFRLLYTITFPPHADLCAHCVATDLVEWVGSCAPVCEEQAEADSLEDAGEDANSDGVNRSLLNNKLRDQLQNDR
jgi:hypothetical protein